MTEYITREIAFTIEKALNSMPVVVLTGMRQSGKSTILKNHPSLINRGYINFDDFAQLEFAKSNPEELLSSNDYLTIDEVQKCPEILTYIKKTVDKHRMPGQFLLSGSANLLLLSNISESLAGRAIYLTLYPFSRREILGTTSADPYLVKLLQSPNNVNPKTDHPIIKFQEVLTGGMPDVCLKKIGDPRFWFQGYEQTYLERDIRDFSRIKDLISFRNLLRLTALRTGQVLKTSEISRDAKLNSVTTGRYLSLLRASYILNFVEPFLSNRSSRLIKSPKIYFSDAGIAGYLIGISSNSETEKIFRGALYETYIAQNILSILSSNLINVNLMFWNIQGRYEVDFVLEYGQKLIAVEIKSGSRWTQNDLSGLKKFLSKNPSCKTAILAYNGEHTVKLGDRLWALPLGILIS